MLDMRKSSLAYLSANPVSSLGKQTGGAGELDRCALNMSTLPSVLFIDFNSTAASSGFESVGLPSVRLITNGGKQSGYVAMKSATIERASVTAPFIGVLPPELGSNQT